jgi:hypothetical protein
LTPAGRELLAAAVPIWRDTHAAIERLVAESGADRLRGDLRALTSQPPQHSPQRRVLAAEQLSP